MVLTSEAIIARPAGAIELWDFGSTDELELRATITSHQWLTRMRLSRDGRCIASGLSWPTLECRWPKWLSLCSITNVLRI
jgi:hypothetical protein